MIGYIICGTDFPESCGKLSAVAAIDGRMIEELMTVETVCLDKRLITVIV